MTPLRIKKLLDIFDDGNNVLPCYFATILP